MPDDEQVDRWADAHTAQEERLAGMPPRAMAKADAFLRAEGSPDVAVTATPNPLLADDLEIPTPNHGNLEGWARQGVLLLNTALTVRAGSEADHKIHRSWRRGGQGWETFTDAVIKAISAKQERVVFILWGADARVKSSLVDTSRHEVIEAVHPSPLSANRGGFFGTRPFSQANQALAAAGRGEIDWSRFGAPS